MLLRRLPLLLGAAAALVGSSSAVSLPLTSRDDCGRYTIISTRGTGEIQGPSIAFETMIRATLANVTGGKEYDTVYPADVDQDSASGTQDIINKINPTLAACPDHRFAILGYSQGAGAVTAALPSLTGAAMEAVRVVVLVGNPRHNKGLKSNYDTNGGNSTAQGFGLQSYLPAVPADWDASGRVFDICAFGDGVCDITSGIGIGPAHFLYTTAAWVQDHSAQQMTAAFSAPPPSTSGAGSSAPDGAAVRAPPRVLALAAGLLSAAALLAAF